MTRLLVRCCCEASKVLGSLPDYGGDVAHFQFVERSADYQLTSQHVTLRIEKLNTGERAYKADGIELDTLLKLRDFRPATDVNFTPRPFYDPNFCPPSQPWPR